MTSPRLAALLACLLGACLLGACSDDSSVDAAPPDAALPDAAPPDAAPLSWSACDTTDWPAGYPTPAPGVECTFIAVPLDHADPGGATIELRVARHKSVAFPTGKAIFQLAGGPGGTSVGQSGLVPLLMPGLRDQYDLVYVDQRGTGGSGYLGCGAYWPATTAEWESCAASHADVDLAHYLTADAADDIDSVRVALGYDTIYLRGGSYGTRLGLEVLRRHGDTVTAAVLDGVAPPDEDMIRQTTALLDYGIGLLTADCDADPACLAVSPTLAADLHARRDALVAVPRPIQIGPYAEVEDEEMYVSLLETFVADSYWRFDVPAAIHQAVLGDNTAWNALMSDAYGYTVTDRASKREAAPRLRRAHPDLFGSYVAPGAYMEIACAEWAPLAGTIAEVTAAADATEWGHFDGVMWADLLAACPAWSPPALDPTQWQPVTSSVPTLVIDGAIDMTTPPAWGAHAAETLAQSRHVIVPQATHSAMVSDCGAAIIESFFLSDCDLDAIDLSCIDSMASPVW